MKLRALLVEDEEDLLDVLDQGLTAAGFEVHAVCELEAAQALLAHENYDLVVTDFALTPVGSEGFEIIRCAHSVEPRPKVLVLTGNSAMEFDNTAKFRGADLVLHKPIQLFELTACAMALIGKGPSS